MDAIDKRDVTDRATAGGWVLPEGWTVRAELHYDDMIGRPDEEYGEDAYSPAMIAAWVRDDWAFGTVTVIVADAAGREWGVSSLGGVEYGTLPLEDEDGNVTGETTIDPLDDAPGEYSALRENDLIGEALRNAVQELEAFGTPVLVEPETAYTGL